MELSLAQSLGKKFGISPTIVQVFISLSRPVRNNLYYFLRSQKTTLQIRKNEFLARQKKGEKVSEKVNLILSKLIEDVIMPIENTLSSIPLDIDIEEYPELSNFLKELTELVPIKIPATTATTIMGIGGFDFFDGVTNFRDLRDKVIELKFRLSRATSLANYAEAGNFLLDSQINKIDKYLNLIETLNLES